MKNSLFRVFGSNGIFLNKRISLHFSLQKGSEHEKKLGSFALDVEGCSNLARKTAFFLLVFFLLFLPILKEKTKKFSKKT